MDLSEMGYRNLALLGKAPPVELYALDFMKRVSASR
jgi:hypothetical protein